MKIYIIGSTATREQLDRAEDWHTRLEKLGVELTSTWLAAVAANQGTGNPRDISREARAQYATADLHGLRQADIVWFLVPPVDQPTRGGWVEWGRAWSLACGQDGTALIASGDTKQSIFCALGREFESDVDAFVEIVQFVLARRA